MTVTAGRQPDHDDPGDVWPRDALAAVFGDDVAGLALVRMLIAHPDWVHRRVDTLEYRDDTTFRRRQSVHFTVPAAAPRIRVSEARFRLVPLTTLCKETLVNFDCRDESGTALPVLTREHQGLLVLRGMTAWAEDIAGGRLAADVADEMAACLTGDEVERAGARAAFAAGGGQRDLLRADAFFSLLLERLTDQFVLVTMVDDPPGTQRIVKFAYEELCELATEPWPRAPLAALCWIPRQAATAAESLFSAESYHFEADLPAGVDVPVASLWVGPGPDDLACVDVDPGDHLRIALRSPGYDRGVAEVRWSLRPARRGWLRAAWFATTVAAVSLAVGAWRLDTITADSSSGTRTELAAAVILAVVGALGGLVARIEEHPLVTHILAWPRRLAAVAAMLPLVAASSLVVGPAGAARHGLWISSAVVAGLIAAAFTVAFVRPATAADRPPVDPRA
ncbi:MAG TPA: hypothetical protein VFI47_29505, partial [Acidimicrobiales bacterium]|nr:hypothetical protein [Acidimicrobiales bacterium]